MTALDLDKLEALKATARRTIGLRSTRAWQEYQEAVMDALPNLIVLARRTEAAETDRLNALKRLDAMAKSNQALRAELLEARETIEAAETHAKAMAEAGVDVVSMYDGNYRSPTLIDNLRRALAAYKETKSHE